jgi:amidase
LPDRYTGFDDDIADYPAQARANLPGDFRDIPHLAKGFAGLEATRKADLEDWMDALGLDAVIFPAVADVGPADADVTPASADLAWRNGVWVANGNLAIRHMGVPTVTLPMGVMADTGMPAGLTFAGRGWEDAALLALGAAFEALGRFRKAPPRTPALGPVVPMAKPGIGETPVLRVEARAEGEMIRLTIRADRPIESLTIDGKPVGGATHLWPRNTHRHSEWEAPRGPLVIARFTDGQAGFVAVDQP